MKLEDIIKEFGTTSNEGGDNGNGAGDGVGNGVGNWKNR